MDDTDPESGANVRAESYCIACRTTTCAYCGSGTRVVALLVPPGHRIRRSDEDDDPEQPGRRLDSWESAPRQALLFDLESMSEPVRHQLQRLAPTFRLTAGPGSEESYWLNHCEQCGAAQEDHELFCEPEGAFVPIDADQAAAIELVPIAEGLVAIAGGYAPDPEFIGFQAGL